jgi:RES domain-containing protein
MRLWRIAGASYPVWSGEGARIAGARWNPAGIPVIYTGTSFAISALEILVHANVGAIPRRFSYVHADVPDDAPIEEADMSLIPGWNSADMSSARAFGRDWLRERRSLVLLVPSVVTNGLDRNALVNPAHPDFVRITVSAESPVAWDPRLPMGGRSVHPSAAAFRARASSAEAMPP